MPRAEPSSRDAHALAESPESPLGEVARPPGRLLAMPERQLEATLLPSASHRRSGHQNLVSSRQPRLGFSRTWKVLSENPPGLPRPQRRLAAAPPPGAEGRGDLREGRRTAGIFSLLGLAVLGDFLC